MMGGWGTFGWLWMLITLLFWTGFLALIVWPVDRIFPGGRGEDSSGEHRPESAEEVLHDRFACGEIGVEEYEERL